MGERYSEPASTSEAFNPDDLFADIDAERAALTPERNDTLDRLAATFGDQKFCYGTHVGTFSDIVAICPAVESIISQGYDGAVNMLGQYSISEEQYQQMVNPDTPEKVDNTDKNPGADTQEKPVDTPKSSAAKTTDASEAASTEKAATSVDGAAAMQNTATHVDSR